MHKPGGVAVRGLMGDVFLAVARAQGVWSELEVRVPWNGARDGVTAPWTQGLVLLGRHIPSTAESEKVRGNQRGPSRKAKYYPATDSEAVP